MELRTFVGAMVIIGAVTGCSDETSTSPQVKAEVAEKRPTENIDADEKAAAAALRPTKDPIFEEIRAFQLEVRQALNNRDFDTLEKTAADLRASKETFGNGSWKIVQFYEAFGLGSKEPDGLWQEHEQIRREWIAAKPGSITAHIAYADFLTDQAWKARGSGFADTVTEEGWEGFREKLGEARKILESSRTFPEKDPMWWSVALTVALGQGWPKDQYDALVAEATTFEPKFWGFDTKRAYSLLPRWFGEPGDWEAYAESAAERPGGLGNEVYARIVIYLRGYHENIFRETKASWPRTREGLIELRKKYPTSLGVISHSAMLAAMAQDREFAKEMFDLLDGKYLPDVWRKPERFVHYRKWAETGRW